MVTDRVQWEGEDRDGDRQGTVGGGGQGWWQTGYSGRERTGMVTDRVQWEGEDRDGDRQGTVGGRGQGW